MDKNLREKMISNLVRQEAGHVIGGYENSKLDGLIDEMPSRAQMAEEIYTEVMSCKILETPIGLIKIEKDIRFLGTATIKQMIDERMIKMGY